MMRTKRMGTRVGRFTRWLERAVLGAGMRIGAWFVERRLLRVVNRKRP